MDEFQKGQQQQQQHILCSNHLAHPFTSTKRKLLNQNENEKQRKINNNQ